MWGWKQQAVREWLGWRFEWWPRLHLSNVQLLTAVSTEARLIVACKALLALLLQGSSSSFRTEFVCSCNGWEAAVWLQEAELKCGDVYAAVSSEQELPALPFSSSSETGTEQPHQYGSSAAATESSSAAASSSRSVSIQ